MCPCTVHIALSTFNVYGLLLFTVHNLIAHFLVSSVAIVVAGRLQTFVRDGNSSLPMVRIGWSLILLRTMSVKRGIVEDNES